MRELFDAEDYLDVEQPKYDIGRSLLRSGPAASLRINMRVVSLADCSLLDTAVSDAVSNARRVLRDDRRVCLLAARNDSSATIKSMSLLQTIPSSVLDKGKAIADSYRVSFSASEENKSEDLDPELKKLEEIL
ncbi:hypothetical protein KSP40_PGU020136 [Platanthera guangdongensis]|uniref:DUF7880 domain-containing protein n=1 Tax=Platanthera guangdongensis TaxID=2320717 RepID=A0ABR2LC67_9ASPA